MAVAIESNSHRYNHRHNNNHSYNHCHKLQPQSLDPPTNSKSKSLNQKKKKKNSKSSTKPQPNRTINDQTQPTISGESCGGRRAKNGDCGGRRAKISDCSWASRASDRRAELQIGELQSTSSALDWRASIGELCFRSESPSS